MEKKKNKYLSNKTFVIFGILAIIICLVAILAPQICGDVDPTKGSLADSIMKPCAEHPFGTDKLGRDIFARVIYGARSSLSSTLILVAVILVVGTFLGILAGSSCDRQLYQALIGSPRKLQLLDLLYSFLTNKQLKSFICCICILIAVVKHLDRCLNSLCSVVYGVALVPDTQLGLVYQQLMIQCIHLCHVYHFLSQYKK